MPKQKGMTEIQSRIFNHIANNPHYTRHSAARVGQCHTQYVDYFVAWLREGMTGSMTAGKHGYKGKSSSVKTEKTYRVPCRCGYGPHHTYETTIPTKWGTCPRCLERRVTAGRFLMNEAGI